MSEKELKDRIEELQHQLNRSKASLKKVKSGKKKKPTIRKKGFDTQKVRSKKGAPGVRPTKKKSKIKRAPKEVAWKPPPIFAQSDESAFAFQASEATALKKKIFDHLKGHIAIRHTASATTIDQMIEEEKNKSEAVSSVFLVNIGWVVDKYLQWKYLMPRVMPFYAVKSNPDVNILRTLKMLGAGFDCASEAELAAVKHLGAASENIIFANPCKGKTHIRYAKQQQVPLMTFDNVDEVDKIVGIYPAAKLVLRILPDDKYSLMPFGKKFGASWEESKVLIGKCIDVKAQLVGVSFHVGSGCFGTVAYEKALKLAREVFDYAATQGITMTLLDIGGGFPGTDDAPLRFEEIACCVTPLLDELFPKSSGVRIIGEPGRYFCSGSSTLAVVVNSKRKKQLVKEPLPAEQDPEAVPPHISVVADEEVYEDYEDDHHDGEDDADPADAVDADDDPSADDAHRLLRPSFSAPELLDLELNRPGLKASVNPDEDSASHTEEEDMMRNPQAIVSTDHEFLYYLSDGVYGSFNNIIFDHAKPQPVLLNIGAIAKKNSLVLYKSRLFGPTCDSIDVICDCVELPELDIGDWLLFPQMGAYTVAAASSFNGFAPPNSTYIMSYDDEETEVAAAGVPAVSGVAAAPPVVPSDRKSGVPPEPAKK